MQTEGGMATQVKCSKENSHISKRRRNDHPDEVLDLLDEICPLVGATIGGTATQVKCSKENTQPLEE